MEYIKHSYILLLDIYVCRPVYKLHFTLLCYNN